MATSALFNKSFYTALPSSRDPQRTSEYVSGPVRRAPCLKGFLEQCRQVAARYRPKILLLIVLLAIGAAGCATSYDKRGVYHKVRSSDTFWQIAKSYGVDVQELAEYNNILDPSEVTAGSKLYIPSRHKKSQFKKLPFGTEVASSNRGGRYSRKKGGDDDSPKSVQMFRGKFDWPVQGRFASPFGMRNGRRHDGVDLVADTGTPIHASAAGRVVFSGTMRGYGNMILVRHADDFFTAYAHNSKNIVKVGQEVKKGQLIAEVGRTGRATAPHLHFEIRHGQTARNPLFFLPAERETKIAVKEKKKKK